MFYTNLKFKKTKSIFIFSSENETRHFINENLLGDMSRSSRPEINMASLLRSNSLPAGH